MPPLSALLHPRRLLAPLALLALSTAAWGQDYAFPTSAEDYPEFYPTAYKDNGGTTDWNCGDITYTGHGGTDLGVGSWAGMDAGRDVTAGADGVVVATHDGEFDRCTTADCPGGGGYGNYVQLLHPDGKSTYYGHLRQWTVAVAVGDAVSCGQKLGEVGSSGHSTGPHLHFEVRNSAGRSEDPFDGPCSAPPTYWVSQGDYAALPGLACEGAPACAPSADLTCGASITTRSDGAGSTSAHAAYGCTTWAYTGAEQVYRVATDRDEPLTLRLSGLSADLDLYVLDRPDCDGSGCLGASDGPDSGDEAVTIEARAGAAYTVVIDGFEGAASDFVLTVDCAGGWPAGLDGGDGSDSTDGADGADGTSDGSGDGASDGASDGAADGPGDGSGDDAADGGGEAGSPATDTAGGDGALGARKQPGVGCGPGAPLNGIGVLIGIFAAARRRRRS